MNHEHLPALKRYTSAKQYEAMQKINDTQSVVKLLMDGAWSRTLGALLRSAWIAPHTYTDADGVVREGWQVTDAGRHAMTLYEAKLEEQRQTEARQEQLRQEQLARETELFGMAVGYFRAVKVQGAYEQMADDWRRKSKEIEYECNRFAMERNVWGSKQVFAKAFAAVKEEGAIDLESYEEWKERQMEGDE